MNTVFLDTVGLLALWDASDQWHSVAESAFVNLKGKRGRTIFSIYTYFSFFPEKIVLPPFLF